MDKTIKCVLVGDSTVGKTSLLISYAKEEFPTEYTPTVFDNYYLNLPTDQGTIKLHMFDTAGNEGYEELRRLCYTSADVYLLCFAVDSMTSYVNIRQHWYPEIRQHSPNAEIILVGTKIDLRNNNAAPKKIISERAGNKLAKDLNLQYSECSALTMEYVPDVFNMALMAVLTTGKEEKGRSFKAKMKKYCKCKIL